MIPLDLVVGLLYIALLGLGLWVLAKVFKKAFNEDSECSSTDGATMPSEENTKTSDAESSPEVK